MSKWNNNFTLFDIFSNQGIAKQLPIINVDRRFPKRKTSTNNVVQQVYLLAVSGAQPYYNPLKPSVIANKVVLTGSTELSLDQAQNAVYEAIKAQRTMLIWTANNIELINSALNDTAKIFNFGGRRARLYLRAGSLQEIKGMSLRRQIAFMTDIMDNIYYNDAFQKTQEKYKLKEQITKNPLTYEERKAAWERKVGIR